MAQDIAVRALPSSRSQDAVLALTQLLTKLHRIRSGFLGIDLRLTYKPETRDSRQRIIPDSNEITDNNMKVTIYIIW